jgi:tripartite-type tricarboxylate transporter receptor subunit TctC
MRPRVPRWLARRRIATSSNAINPALNANQDPASNGEIAPIVGISRNPLVVEVTPSRTLAEFIAYAKANPGKINMAISGYGTPHRPARRVVQDDDRREHG